MRPSFLALALIAPPLLTGSLPAFAQAQPSTSPPPPTLVDGMVGQVNGTAIYAATVLDPIHDQLRGLSRELPPAEFRVQAEDLINRMVHQIVMDRLILAEATRNLNEGQQRGVEMLVRQQREELLRQYGQRSLALAERNLMAETGKTLQETLQEFRNFQVVRYFYQQRLNPKVNVTRRAVERYYQDHLETFNPPINRTLRLIRVRDAGHSAHLLEQLAAGADFETLAREPENLYRPETGGLMENAVGEQVFGPAPLNDALGAMKEKQFAGPLQIGGQFWFLYVEKITSPPRRSLQDVQLQIESLLYEEQYRQLNTQHQRELLEKGSFHSIPEMVGTLLEIAMNRYRPTAGAG